MYKRRDMSQEQNLYVSMRSLTTNCRLRGVRSDSAPTPILNHFNFVGEIRAIRDVVQNDPAPSGVESPPPPSFSNPRSATDRNKPQTPALRAIRDVVQNDPAPSGVESPPPPPFQILDQPLTAISIRPQRLKSSHTSLIHCSYK